MVLLQPFHPSPASSSQNIQPVVEFEYHRVVYIVLYCKKGLQILQFVFALQADSGTLNILWARVISPISNHIKTHYRHLSKCEAWYQKRLFAFLPCILCHLLVPAWVSHMGWAEAKQGDETLMLGWYRSLTHGSCIPDLEGRMNSGMVVARDGFENMAEWESTAHEPTLPPCGLRKARRPGVGRDLREGEAGARHLESHLGRDNCDRLTPWWKGGLRADGARQRPRCISKRLPTSGQTRILISCSWENWDEVMPCSKTGSG